MPPLHMQSCLIIEVDTVRYILPLPGYLTHGELCQERH